MPDIVWPIVISACIIGFVCFVFVIAFGAPFLPTHKPQVHDALKMLALKKGQTVVELGSGDGRVLREAARQGIKAIGIELNPLLVLYSRLLTWRYRSLVKIIWGNYWRMKLPACDGIFVFLLKPYMTRLDHKIIKEAKKPQKLVSYAFTIEGKEISDELHGLYRYDYR